MVDFSTLRPPKAKVFLETYGCQMNIGDSEVVASILIADNYEIAKSTDEANIVLLNTCAIRDNAEQKIFNRLKQLRGEKKYKGRVIGVIGCMAERLGEELFELCDIVAGPDAYRSLPNLIEQAQSGIKGINTQLSIEETYKEIDPVRYSSNGISAFVSIMRGCNNFCTYCVVPYTRGRERSREAATILREVQNLLDNGYKEVTLLGQNVNSYQDGDITFAKLMGMVADLSPNLRLRFSTSHPKDLSDELIEVMRTKPNIAKNIHLPVQSGSDNMLSAMNRKYTTQWYMGRVDAIMSAMPDCTLSTDIIAGFCGESEEDHKATIELMKKVGYAAAYMFAYSDRPGTVAHKSMNDDVKREDKIRRLEEIISLQNNLSLQSNTSDIGKTFSVLVEGRSKRSESQLVGRSSQNKVIVFDAREGIKAGDFVEVRVLSASSATLHGELI